MRLLLRGADLIDTDPAPVLLPGHDLLVEDGRIAAVGSDLPVADAEVLDLTGKQVLPGFVDTHRHTWQGALRAAAVDAVLSEYLQLVRLGFGPKLRPQDLAVATLAGARQCLDSGITTLLDFADAQLSPEHTAASLEALEQAGIRAVFGYGGLGAPGTVVPDQAAAQAALEAVRGDITMALAPPGPSYSDYDRVAADWRTAAELGLRIITHTGAGPIAQRPIQLLRDKGLLRPETTFVHANSLPDDELAMIAEVGATVSIAPAVEAQMGHGAPMAGRLRAAGITTGLGVDVVTTVPADMFNLMRATLLTSQFGPGPRLLAADALRLATIDGARTLGRADDLGSLTPGKRADLIIYRPDPIAARHDPIGALVALGDPTRVDTVLVGGTPRKRNGALLGPNPEAALLASTEYLLTH